MELSFKDLLKALLIGVPVVALFVAAAVGVVLVITRYQEEIAWALRVFAMLVVCLVVGGLTLMWSRERK